MLKNGEYLIVVEKEDGSFEKFASIPVAIATSRTPDEQLYAPLENARFVRGDESQPPRVVLSGTYTNTCMALKDVKVAYRANHVIEVLPGAQEVDGARPFVQ